MRRRANHIAFGAVALVCAAVASYQGVRLQRALKVNHAIASARESVGGGASGSGDESAASAAALARATALAAAGDQDAALKGYHKLIRARALDAVGRTALFNLGNLYLREGLAHSGTGAATFLPVIELAKQQYRDLLRVDPDDWDARYNLERALRLAPEDREGVIETQTEPVGSRELMLHGMTSEDLP